MDEIKNYILQLCRLNYSRQTITVYKSLLNVFEDWLNEEGIKIQNTTRQDLDRFIVFINEQNKTISSSRANYIKVLRSFFRHLKAENQILTNPAVLMTYPKKRKRIHQDVLNNQEWLRLQDGFDNTASGLRDKILIQLLSTTGMRIGSLCNLLVGDIDLKTREIIARQAKGRRDEQYFIAKEIVEQLKDYLLHSRPVLANPRCDYLIVGDKGGKIQPRQAGVILNRHRKRRRIKKILTPHSLRRTLASLLQQSGMNLKSISLCLNHRLLSTTADYQELNIDDIQRVYNQSFPLE